MSPQCAIVTGGSRGIGAAIVERFAADGFNILINYRNNVQAAISVQERLLAAGGHNGQIELYQCDVSQLEPCRKMVEHAIGLWGRIDVLVNNAGISKGGLLLMSKMDDWWQVVQNNLGSTVNCTKLVAQHMIRQRAGHIINIGSVSAIRGTVGNSNYSASKGAIAAFTKAMARELIRWGIQVNCVAPGFIESDMTNGLDSARIKESVPARRMGHVSEVAEIVAVLASGKVNYVLGQNIIVDGGTTL